MTKIIGFVVGAIALHIFLPQVSITFWQTLAQFFFAKGGVLAHHIDVLGDIKQMTAGYIPQPAPYTHISY